MKKTVDNKKDKLGIKEKKFKPGELKQIVLAALGIGVVLGGSVFLTPNFPIVLGSILKVIEEIKQIKLPKRKAIRVLKQLEKEEIIFLNRKKDQVEVVLKDQNNTKILKYSIKEILELKKKAKKWDGKWFIVMFDVPEKQKNKRDYLRRFLYEIGFYPYQQSVYVYPYECEKEIMLIKKIVESGKYINYIVAERLENQDELLTYFQIKNHSSK